MEEVTNTQTDTQVSETATETDNSTSTSDSGQETLEQQISKALEEPEETDTQDKEEKTDKTTEEEPKDNTVECPDKFKKEDGTADLEKVLKSYKELESNSSKKEAEWQKERAELLKFKEQQEAANKVQEERAKAAGYDSVQDMQQVYEIASLEANEYAKYLQYTENPEEVRNLLIQYANNPTPDLMEEIEMEFAPEVNKRVAVASERLRQQYATQKQEYEQTVKMSSIENVISQAVDENSEIFNYKPFKDMFVNALQKFGDAFTFDDAKALMNTFNEMKELYKAEFEKEAGIKLQNKQATDNIAGISTNNSAPAAKQTSNIDIDKLSDADLRKEISKYI